MNGIKVNWIADFPLKIESSELKIVTKFKSHNAYSCARCYSVSRRGGEGVFEVGNRKRRCYSFAYVTCKPILGGWGQHFLWRAEM